MFPFLFLISGLLRKKGYSGFIFNICILAKKSVSGLFRGNLI